MPLKVSDGIGAWIKDFKKSDAPQFKGKSDKERRDQAVAAYLSAKKGPLPESTDKRAEVQDRISRLQKKRQAARSAASETDSPMMKRRHAMKAQIAQKQIQMAQQRMNNIGEASCGTDMKKRRSEDSDAVKAFLAKGGKIKKLPPAKAQGYHGKDDPGQGVSGMLDRPDTKKSFMGTRKKVKSMESVIKYTHVAVDKKGKVAGMASKASDAKDMARRHGGTHHQLKKPMHPKVGDMMINRPFNPVLKKENVSTSSGSLGEVTMPPAKEIMKHIGDTKHAGQAREILKKKYGVSDKHADKMINHSMGQTEAKQTHMFDNEKDARAKAKEIGGKYVKGTGKSDGKHAAIKNESTYNKLNTYNKDAKRSKDRATNSAVATILRKGDHSKDLNTMRKRERGLKLVKSRITDKIRKGHKKDEGYVSHAQRKAVWAARNDEKEGKKK